jgi:predicted O-methyltransferase YrrM
MPGLVFLEVGCFEGRATVWLLENVLTHPSSRIVCVDSFDVHAEQEAFFDANVALVGATARVEKKKGLTVSVLPALAGRTFDWIYVDADHRAISVLTDAVLGWPLLRRGGYLVFDDYEWDRKLLEPEFLDHPQLAFLSTRRGIDAFLAFTKDHAERVHQGYQVVLKRTV